MAPELENRVPREIFEESIEQGSEALREVLEKLMNLAMQLERSDDLRAEPYERSPQRRGYANGFKDKRLSTRVGKLQLKIL